MPIIQVKALSLSLGTFPLLDQANFQIEAKERIAIIGRNGEGKSTLLKILAKKEYADSGEILIESNYKVAILDQSLPLANDKTVYEVVAQGLSELNDLIEEYNKHTQLLVPDNDEKWFEKLNKLQSAIEQKGGWDLNQKILKVLTDLDLPQESKMSELSGGWRRRVALAQVLVQSPDLLLLDEPTNHLDFEAIQWLENVLIQYPHAILFITHDRALLKKVATRILELDRGMITSYPGNYSIYQSRKLKALEDEAAQNAHFDKVLAQEEAWIRQGIKARRTRNEGRVRALKALRAVRAQRREQQSSPKMTFQVSDQSQGKHVFSAESITFSYDSKDLLIENYSTVIQRGDKVAFIGANGAGKTTLIKLLMGEILPTSGHVKISPKAKIAYFDQNRAQINLQISLIDNVAEGDDFIEINGQKKHIISYLGDFLFSPEKARGPASALSGGELNRLLLAKLFSKPANVLVLDEPTNDLDIESLEMLEELVLNYSGTIIIISHDREFIDNVATQTVVLSGKGKVTNYVGGFSDWKDDNASSLIKESVKNKKNNIKNSVKENNKIAEDINKNNKKLSFKDKRELELLPQLIENLENKISNFHKQMALPTYYQQTANIIQADKEALQVLEAELEKAYEKWDRLESN